jgi:hypothetical protein
MTNSGLKRRANIGIIYDLRFTIYDFITGSTFGNVEVMQFCGFAVLQFGGFSMEVY